ncbi:Na+/H+ antiporter subunit C [Cupriavidus sp. TA19]|uniref:Na+/H+ antiporter subunit C n=1 Tax=unclassified Cupriavidus TaxID=2640874 RepID=UPI002729478A|nr:Na+/H+ antiporter subunit C [Cupriavidus sp. TA19]GLC92212.1 Na+/H+ antiporter subunit C [Cupriavidus sp. TA19]
MAALYAVTIGILTACGIYLLLRERVFTVVLGLTLLSYAVSLFLLGMGRLSIGQPPVIVPGASYADPLPQALVLTAIVIAFGMTAFAVVLALRSLGLTGSDHVDAAGEPENTAAPDPDGDDAGSKPEPRP